MGSVSLNKKSNKKKSVNKWIVASRTNKTQKYEVIEKDGNWSCTCPAFKYKKVVEFNVKTKESKPICKHIKFIKDKLKKEKKKNNSIFLVNL